MAGMSCFVFVVTFPLIAKNDSCGLGPVHIMNADSARIKVSSHHMVSRGLCSLDA